MASHEESKAQEQATLKAAIYLGQAVQPPPLSDHCTHQLPVQALQAAGEQPWSSLLIIFPVTGHLKEKTGITSPHQELKI